MKSTAESTHISDDTLSGVSGASGFVPHCLVPPSLLISLWGSLLKPHTFHSLFLSLISLDLHVLFGLVVCLVFVWFLFWTFSEFLQAVCTKLFVQSIPAVSHNKTTFVVLGASSRWPPACQPCAVNPFLVSTVLSFNELQVHVPGYSATLFHIESDAAMFSRSCSG